AGDAYAIRGGSAQPDAARVATTFMGMSDKDTKKWSIPDGHSQHEYVRIDEAKSNLGPVNPEPHWYWRKQIIVEGYRGGRLPGLVATKLEARDAAKTEDLAGLLARAIRDRLTSDTWLHLSLIVSHLPGRLADKLKGRNRARALDEIFGKGDDEVM